MKKIALRSNNRLCVHFPTLLPGVPQECIDVYLRRKGYEKANVNIVALAREQIGKNYSRGSKSAEQSFDCSSLMQWLYGQKGMYIPRISIDQREFGDSVEFKDIRPGDLLFTNGNISYYWDNEKENSVGHVGLYTGESVIHAANKKRGVVEDTIENFLKTSFRGAARMHEHILEAQTLLIPEKHDVEYDTHLRWRILASMH